MTTDSRRINIRLIKEAWPELWAELEQISDDRARADRFKQLANLGCLIVRGKVAAPGSQSFVHPPNPESAREPEVPKSKRSADLLRKVGEGL